MARGQRVRWLVVGAERFRWSVGHAHEVADEPGAPRYLGCRETLTIGRGRSRARVVVVFHGGDGNLVADGIMPSGAVVGADGRSLNLHEPGVVRALLDEARAQGWSPDDTASSEVDGWTLFAGAMTRLGDARSS